MDMAAVIDVSGRETMFVWRFLCLLPPLLLLVSLSGLWSGPGSTWNLSGQRLPKFLTLRLSCQGPTYGVCVCFPH